MGKVAQLLRNYPDVALKLSACIAKVYVMKLALSAHISSVEETNALSAYARQCGINKVLTIL